MRVGIGYDVHKLVENRPLILGGVNIPHSKGLLGHSDADVLLHAIMDSLLGALALGDIGKHFPDTSESYKGISSLLLLKKVGNLINSSGYSVENLDSTIIAQKPKISPYITEIRKNIAYTLGIDIGRVSVKATTEEGLGFSGREEGISSQSICLLNYMEK
ncbi:2-C-methyl-D-erythritol 2,4-cyclodiphosphate synthase [Clostridium sp. PL3]|uniref:2-C-methyl-D-erythritol 2,4-cyclodiphosphate synthase n=1 Tax=Clostridium thailandense TaxID=2794346 RepID=A0A949X3W6_9CLOT|nr:2-C-methyl-D-erythritol 2,4-cyclodiphosphate synthase [Clostridium thailandense]MBV7275404.1 2-C-methyl-D-erythritol 2,4-cyclodiphosphate synthase [Clostridium thailandense]